MWNQAHAMLACDFFVTVTAGFRVLYVFVVMEVRSRRLVHVNVTRHPTAAWALQRATTCMVPPRGIQPRRARHPDPQHRADDLIDQGIRLHGISTWRTDRQDFESRTKQIRALAFKRCPVPFFASGP
ncbi:MAG: hypothetical protein ABSD47_11190 [Candidatus Methylomirabilota bacterium]